MAHLTFPTFFTVREVQPHIVEVHAVGLTEDAALGVIDDLIDTITATLAATLGRYSAHFEMSPLGNGAFPTGLRVHAHSRLMTALASQVVPHLRTVILQCVQALHAGVDITRGPSE